MQTAAMGIVTAVCAITVRKQAPELGALLAICGGTMILIRCVGTLAVVTEFSDKLAVAGNLSGEVTKPVIKVTGIAIVTRLAADFCRDSKESALAATVELAGGAAALLTMLPLMSLIQDLIGELI